MNIVPRRFFIASGSALSDVSEMNAFDRALVKAGISEANLVPVSSVLPAGVARATRCKIERGAITFCVLSRISDKGECRISSGLAYGFREDGLGGYVAEGQVHGDGKALRKELRTRILEMAKDRSVAIKRVEYVTSSITIPKGKYGSCVVALVFSE
ncbi:MAG: pyruvoyl-dependent arginine decarboxylase [Thermoplasmata archaeon]